MRSPLFQPQPARPIAAILAAAIAGMTCGCERPSPEDESPLGPESLSRIEAGVPSTTITSGPRDGGTWTPDVAFRWTSTGATHHRWTLLSLAEFRADRPTEQPLPANLLAWADTLQFHVLPDGRYDSHRPAWNETRETSVTLREQTEEVFLFAVRGVAGAVQEPLSLPQNTRRFRTRRNVSGPRIFVASDMAGTWSNGNPVTAREVFRGGGLQFTWQVLPGITGAPVAAIDYAVGDTVPWTPLPPDQTSWPPGDARWYPELGTRSFFLRARDAAGAVSELEVRLAVFGGPPECSPQGRNVLVVLDTDPNHLIVNGVFPLDYRQAERALVSTWFSGRTVEIFETHGRNAPTAADLACATSVFWFHSALVGVHDESVLEALHRTGLSILPSYVASGGNLFLCGIQPTNAMRYFQKVLGDVPLQPYPVAFDRTLTNPALVPHWVAARLGIGSVDETVANTFLPHQAGRRLRVATSALPDRYPDLEFDPLRLPHGPDQGGFGYHDRGVRPLGGADVVYTFNDTGIPIGVRNLAGPGPSGNTFFLGFHPYFMVESEFLDLLDAVWADFGEGAVIERHDRREVGAR